MSFLTDRNRVNDESINDESIKGERGAIGYIFLWLMGVPAGVLFVIFLMRGCT